MLLRLHRKKVAHPIACRFNWGSSCAFSVNRLIRRNLRSGPLSMDLAPQLGDPEPPHGRRRPHARSTINRSSGSSANSLKLRSRQRVIADVACDDAAFSDTARCGASQQRLSAVRRLPLQFAVTLNLSSPRRRRTAYRSQHLELFITSWAVRPCRF
jgi:hypothetical protein